MKVILAGLPKTGTKSLAEALRVLGYTVHDYPEHVQFFLDEYIEALEGKMPDFKAMYKDVDAVTDVPSIMFWEEIKKSFPDAKVILMERDSAEAWTKSLLGTMMAVEQVWSQLWLIIASKITPMGRKWWNLHHLMNIRTKEDIAKYGDFPSIYHKHNAMVKEIVPRDELLVYNVKQGWQPLCDFLGIDVPDVDFPRLNVKSSGIRNILMHSSVCKKTITEVLIIFALLFALIAIVIYAFVK